MIRSAAVLSLALVLLAAPALAEEPDAETRFHDAYVLEVIDGEIAGAAKAYLALVGDEGVPARIRDESRFRFAICTVLLGRPDEGRMQLAAIVENKRTPANLKKRAEAYLESISALGAGTELEKKLQALVFDLGRSDISAYDVAAYRDFEIIGEPAIPFLERLLQHADVRLRRHAFRILIRLGAEDLISKWTPVIGFPGGTGFQFDLVNRYLAQRPDEVRRLEASLLALPDDRLSGLLRSLTVRVPWSFAFVRALAVRGDDLMDRAFRHHLAEAGTRPQQWAFVRECILGADVRIHEAACTWALSQQGGPPEDMAVELWLPVLRRAAALGGPWLLNELAGTMSGNLQAWAQRLPTDRLLHALAGLVAMGEETPINRPTPLCKHGVAGLVARPLAERELDARQIGRYESLVRRWAEVVAPTFAGEMKHHDVNPAARPLRNVIERLPADRAAALVRWLFEGPAHERVKWFKDVVAIEKPGDVALLVEAVRAADTDQRATLLLRLPSTGKTSPSVEILRAELDALPELLSLTSLSAMNARYGNLQFWPALMSARGRVPDDALVGTLKDLFETAATQDQQAPGRLFDHLVDFRSQTAAGLRQVGAFLARCVLPALDAQVEALPPAFQRHALDKVLLTLRHNYGFERGDQERVATWILRHQDLLQIKDLPVLAAHLDLFPLERWLPNMPEVGRIFDLPIEGGEVDASLRTLTTDVERVGGAVLTVVVGFASPDLAQDVADRMLASADPATRHRILEALRPRSAYPATPDGLEQALALTLAEETPDLSDLAKIARLLSEQQPSEKLLPAAERLLASEDPSAQLQGVLLAKRLGREELVPALARLLSSLDAKLRDRAKSTIQAIQELKRLQEEAGGAR